MKGANNLAFIERKCDKCGSNVKFNFTQRINSYNELSWSGGYICNKCNDAMEVDGVGIIDEPLRSAILDQEGLWGLLVEEKLDKIEFIKIIRNALNLNIKEIKRIKERIPGIVITGTNVEMQRLQLLLKIEGLMSEVVKVN